MNQHERLIERELLISSAITKLQMPKAREMAIFCYAELSSTMDQARELINSGEVCVPAAIDCKIQVAGRGRQGRNWQSPADALKFTLVMESLNPQQMGLPLVVSCVLHQVIASLGAQTIIKWPNDLLTSAGKKISGILIERAQHTGKTYDLIGIGINTFTNPNLEQAACLAEITAENFSPEIFYAQLLVALQVNVDNFYKQGISEFIDYWLGNSFKRGTKITFTQSGQKIEGLFLGLGANGSLLLEVDGQQREFYSGYINSINQDTRVSSN